MRRLRSRFCPGVVTFGETLAEEPPASRAEVEAAIARARELVGPIVAPRVESFARRGFTLPSPSAMHGAADGFGGEDFPSKHPSESSVSDGKNGGDVVDVVGFASGAGEAGASGPGAVTPGAEHQSRARTGRGGT